jgi:uncharacterized protein
VTAFVDTSAIYALLDRSDDGHARAVRGQQDLLGEELVTHGYVVVETISIVHRRLGPVATARLIDDFLPALRIVDVNESLRTRATAGFRAAVGSHISLVDRTSFEIMRDLSITRAFALDGDFQTAGFVLVS